MVYHLLSLNPAYNAHQAYTDAMPSHSSALDRCARLKQGAQYGVSAESLEEEFSLAFIAGYRNVCVSSEAAKRTVISKWSRHADDFCFSTIQHELISMVGSKLRLFFLQFYVQLAGGNSIRSNLLLAVRLYMLLYLAMLCKLMLCLNLTRSQETFLNSLHIYGKLKNNRKS